jgi:hypothetical protein
MMSQLRCVRVRWIDQRCKVNCGVLIVSERLGDKISVKKGCSQWEGKDMPHLAEGYGQGT